MRSLPALTLIFVLVLATERPVLCQSITTPPGPDNQSSTRPDAQLQDNGLAGRTDKIANGTKLALSSGATSIALTNEAREVANILNLPNLLANLDQLKTRVQNNNSSSTPTPDALYARLELLEAKQEYEKRVLKASLEVDYVLAAIDGEQHRFEMMLSDFQSDRDTSVLLTNIAAQVTNGVLWILSCSYTLASRTNPKYDQGDGMNGVLAGAIPSVLGLYALYQLRGRPHDLAVNPNMLAPLLGTGKDPYNYYPKSVMDFLNMTAGGETSSRRQVLVERWTKSKAISTPSQKNYDRSTQIISGTIAQRKALTMSLLQKQITMLSDVRTQVCSMKKGLLELMPALD